MTVSLAQRARIHPLLAGGMAFIALYVAVLAWMSVRWPYSIWGVLVVAPILFGLSLPLMAAAARKEGTEKFFWFLMLALFIKFVGSMLRYYVVSDVYGGGDAIGYHQFGVTFAERFRHFDFSSAGEQLSGTGFMRYLTGLVYAVTGPSVLAGFLVFSWFSFWGLYLWYRAFRVAVPDGDARWYQRVIFLMPSMMFWPSSIGKEAWMCLWLGLAVYGVARIMTHSLGRGVVATAIGLWMGGIVRPHYAVLVIAAATIAYFLRKTPAHKRSWLGPVPKIVGIGLMLALTLLFVSKAESFFGGVSRKGDSSVLGVLEETQTRSQTGGSSFDNSIVRSPLQLPGAMFTVIFRPLPHEARSVAALLSAMEGMVLLAFCWLRRRSLLLAVRRVRTVPYLAFAGTYVALYCAAFASIGNFGILARQRVLMLPAFLALFALTRPPVRHRGLQSGLPSGLPKEVAVDA